MAQDDAAQQLYLEIIRQDPTCTVAVLEFGTLAARSGRRSAARTLFQQAIWCRPNDPRPHVALGNLLCQDHAHDAARRHFDAALVLAPALPQAHQGLARRPRRPGASPRRRSGTGTWGFLGHAVGAERGFRGIGPAIPHRSSAASLRGT